MSDGMVYAKSTDRPRAILLGAMTSAWYGLATDGERRRVVDCFRKMTDEWQRLGASVVGTLDDDLFMVGEPTGGRFTFFLLFDIDSPQVVVEMIQQVREQFDGIRMDHFVRFEAHVGRPFFLLEPADAAF